MKYWFFLVVLANLVLFLWEVQNGSLASKTKPTTNAEQFQKQILLVSELFQQDSKKSIGLATKKNQQSRNSKKLANEVKEVLNCYKVGPFENLDALSTWLNKIQISDDKFEHFYSDPQSSSKFLVYYPSADSYVESAKNEKMLKEKGVANTWLYLKGEMKGAISLGMFKKREGAENLVKELSGKGIQAKLLERLGNKKSLFARVNMQEKPVDLPRSGTVTNCLATDSKNI